MMNLDRELLFRFFNKETTLEEEKKIRLWIDECDEHRREFFRERQLFDAILLHGDPSYERAAPDSIFHGIKWWLLFPVLQRL